MIKNKKVDYDYSSNMIIIDKKIIKLTPNENKIFYAIINKTKISHAELCQIVYNKPVYRKRKRKNSKRSSRSCWPS